MLGIDLSERYSAAVLLDHEGHYKQHWLGNFGPRTQHHTDLIANMLDWLEQIEASGFEEVTMEDTPARVLNPKPAMRLSGAMLGALWAHSKIRPLVVSPGVWQKALGFRPVATAGRKTSAQRKAFARQWATDHGLDVSTMALNAKAREDVADAFCLAHYGRTQTGSP